MKYLALLALVFLARDPLRSQSGNDSTGGFVFLPDNLHFAPLKSNVEEPRIGVLKFLDSGEMKVDIGNTIDVFGFSFSRSRFTCGIDFFAYAYVTGAQGLRLQIDAINGFFGGNLTFSHDVGEDAANRVYARLRILHESAHLVDGNYSAASKSWLGNREPFPFTRDFGELLLAHTISENTFSLRSYGGLSYATLVRPGEIQRLAYLSGLEAYNTVGILFGQPANVLLSYTLTLNGTPEYAASHQVIAGVKFGAWYAKGPTIYLACYTGRHIFAEYFDSRLTMIGAGFTVDFF